MLEITAHEEGAEVMETLKTYDPVAQWNDP
jgi:hypothetical protein